MPTLFTIGYQGQNIETFLDALQGHGITHLIDVRQLPFSRKPDFSKKRLSAHLAAVGIGYTHLVDLGTPRSLRDEVQRSKDYAAFFAQMDALMAQQPAALDEALALIRAGSCVLLCFEANAAECHRTSVAKALANRSTEPLSVVDL
jgi:uncharacterized protein (DUF488 family)